MKLSIISAEISDGLADAAGVVRDRGFQGVELYAFDGKLVEEMTREEILNARELLSAQGLKVSCFASTLFLVCPLNNSYEAFPVEGFPTFVGDYQAQKEKFRQMAEYANLTGAPYLRVFPFKMPKEPIQIGKEIVDQLVSRFGEIGDLAEECGVKVCVETCPHSLGGSGIIVDEVLRQVNNPRLGILWDCGNSFVNDKRTLPAEIAEVSIYQEIEQILQRVVHIHLKDFVPRQTANGVEYEHTLFGTGCLDYRKIFQTLIRREYDGYLSLEPYLDLRNAVLSMDILKILLDRENIYHKGAV